MNNWGSKLVTSYLQPKGRCTFALDDMLANIYQTPKNLCLDVYCFLAMISHFLLLVCCATHLTYSQVEELFLAGFSPWCKLERRYFSNPTDAAKKHGAGSAVIALCSSRRWFVPSIPTAFSGYHASHSQVRYRRGCDRNSRLRDPCRYLFGH